VVAGRSSNPCAGTGVPNANIVIADDGEVLPKIEKALALAAA
jgi:hypothetical protein